MNALTPIDPDPLVVAARAAADAAERQGRNAHAAAVSAVIGLRPSWPMPLISDAVDAALWGS